MFNNIITGIILSSETISLYIHMLALLWTWLYCHFRISTAACLHLLAIAVYRETPFTITPRPPSLLPSVVVCINKDELMVGERGNSKPVRHTNSSNIYIKILLLLSLASICSVCVCQRIGNTCNDAIETRETVECEIKAVKTGVYRWHITNKTWLQHCCVIFNFRLCM